MLFGKTHLLHNHGSLGGLLWNWEEVTVSPPPPPLRKAVAHPLSPEAVL